ncbi:uncharacterized protein LOC141503181 [Macrotis lagotis]|uniref:uncharacterized protein LOC141503181 n=1 Tax=Macrotis lagotis TaxID=92651 RepID=UPI003D688AF6
MESKVICSFGLVSFRQVGVFPATRGILQQPRVLRVQVAGSSRPFRLAAFAMNHSAGDPKLPPDFLWHLRATMFQESLRGEAVLWPGQEKAKDCQMEVGSAALGQALVSSRGRGQSQQGVPMAATLRAAVMAHARAAAAEAASLVAATSAASSGSAVEDDQMDLECEGDAMEKEEAVISAKAGMAASSRSSSFLGLQAEPGAFGGSGSFWRGDAVGARPEANWAFLPTPALMAWPAHQGAGAHCNTFPSRSHCKRTMKRSRDGKFRHSDPHSETNRLLQRPSAPGPLQPTVQCTEHWLQFLDTEEPSTSGLGKTKCLKVPSNHGSK